jgi:peptidoglycan hydrolase-like protein with peptidoglycan-binding domain
MKKIIRIKESELVHLIKKFLNENKNIKKEKSLLKEYYNFTKNLSLGSKGQEVQELQELLKSLGYNLGTSGIYGDGIDGDYGGKTSTAISNYQSYKGLKQTGVFTPSLGKSLISDYSKGLKPGKPGVGAKAGGAATAATSTTSQAKKFDNLGLSKQVIKQLEYLETNKLMSNERFTILDDKNSRVHLFNSGYKFLKTYYVITGRQYGDRNFENEFYKGLWSRATEEFKKALNTFDFGTFFKKMKEYKDGGYKTGNWNIAETPSGLFRRATGIIDRSEDLLQELFNTEIVGKKFISWQTLDNLETPVGWHGIGSKISNRLPALTKEDAELIKNAPQRKLSTGCVNFLEKDIVELEKSIGGHERSIWLPSDGTNIVQVPTDLHSPSLKKRAKNAFDYIVQGGSDDKSTAV